MDDSVNRKQFDDRGQSLFENGCGLSPVISFTIAPTTGGQYNLEMAKDDSVENLKRIISKRLKVSKERICLLHKERQLIEGTLEENQVTDGSRLTLLPMVETGLTAQKPELSVMNALESLNEAQVNDFLSGKAPLNLTMRLGDHMMLIQLMLSTFSNQNHGSSRAAKSEDVSKSNAMAVEETPQTRKSVATETEPTPSTSGFGSATASSPGTRLEKILSSASGTVSHKPQNCTSKPSTERQLERDDSQNRASPRLHQSTTSDVTATVSRLMSNVSVGETKKCPQEYQTTCTCNSCPRLQTTSCSLDSIALSEATRNLTQTLKKLSSEVLTTKRVASVPQKYKGLRSNVSHHRRKPNAIIENMEHHGRGIYSGTFSGTLNPALQDRFGRPKKDVSTIIHILNDLLCAGPRPHCHKSSCMCKGASVSSPSSSSNVADVSAHSHSTAVNEQVNSTVQVPVAAVASSSELLDILSKSDENQTTRNKMKHLRSIMEERKEKRKAKRFTPYVKQFSCVDVISSENITSESWPKSSASDASSSIHPTKTNESIEPEATCSIHSEPVIA